MGRFIAVHTNWGDIVAEYDETNDTYDQFAEASSLGAARRLRDALNAQEGQQ